MVRIKIFHFVLDKSNKKRYYLTKYCKLGSLKGQDCTERLFLLFLLINYSYLRGKFRSRANKIFLKISRDTLISTNSTTICETRTVVGSIVEKSPHIASGVDKSTPPQNREPNSPSTSCSPCK